MNQTPPRQRPTAANPVPMLRANGVRRGRGRQLALALLTAFVVLASGAPAAAGAGTAKIKGMVTEAKAPKAAIPEAEVAVRTPSGEFVAFAKANTSGEYTVSALAVGSYKVQFLAPEGSPLAGQYYNGKTTLGEADPVSIVTAGQVETGINAELHEGGKISGTVKNGSHEGLEKIAVTAYPAAGGEEFAGGFASTGRNGEYVITGLPSGSYEVEFAPAPGSGLDFAPQFWEERSSFSTANTVPVTEGATTAEINATLQPGGEISGRVVDAVTHAPVEDVSVFAEDVGEELFSALAVTNANGEYEITGLAGGSYRVEFSGESEGGIEYAPQYYNGESSLASANLIEVRPGSPLSGINASLVQASPRVEIVAPVASTLSPTAAPASHPPPSPSPSPSPPAPVIALSTTKLVVSGSSAKVGIACASAPCSGAIEVSEQVVVKQREGKRTISRREAVVLARGSYVLAAGHSGTFKITFTATGRSKLAGASHHRLSATLEASVAGGRSAEGAVAVSEASSKRT